MGDSLATGPEQEVAEEPALRLSENHPPLFEPKKVVPPSLATFERAVSARIYFENPYFPLLRLLASNDDWQKGTTSVKHRHRVYVSVFIQFKIIDHEENATGSYDCLQTPKFPHARRISLTRNESLASCSL